MIASTATLQSDLDLLTELHTQVLRESGRGHLVDLMNRLVDACRPLDGPPGDLPDGVAAVEIAAGLDADVAAELTRAVTVHLHLTNLADERQRSRALRVENPEYSGGLDTGDVWPAIDAIGAAAEVHLEQLRIHPVLTAHPTEARRRAVSSALRRIAEQLDRLDDPANGPGERAMARRRLLEDVNILQRTSTLRRTRPEPSDEVKTALTVFDQTLFRAVPRLYRVVESALAQREARNGEPGGERGPASAPAFVQFGSWVGGDRDGNPFVTAEVTRQTLSTQAGEALAMLTEQVDRVARTLTMDAHASPPSAALLTTLANDAVAMPETMARIVKDSPSEPHRQKLLAVGARVAATRAERAGWSYADPEEMLADLTLVQDSLIGAGDSRSAHGELQHLIWIVQTFGFHLAELEVRQHSAVHEAALVELFGRIGAVDGVSIADPLAAARDAVLLDRLATEGWPAPATRQQSCPSAPRRCSPPCG